MLVCWCVGLLVFWFFAGLFAQLIFAWVPYARHGGGDCPRGNWIHTHIHIHTQMHIHIQVYIGINIDRDISIYIYM